MKDRNFLGREQQANYKRFFESNHETCLFNTHHRAANTSGPSNVIMLSSDSFRCRREVYPGMPWHQTKAGQDTVNHPGESAHQTHNVR